MAAPSTDPRDPATPHVPVLLDAILKEIGPVKGTWLDGTFGAGGYARALVRNGAERVIGVDRDPEALRRAEVWLDDFQGRIHLVHGHFGELDEIAGHYDDALAGVVLDIGVSSMQLDQAERGFSFQKEGPLDMRMEQEGLSAADLVNTLPEANIADILFRYGEERASRRIARAIVAARAIAPFQTTLQLASCIEKCLPRPKPGQPHSATRSFQALRIAVNDELGELTRGLSAAERALKPGGLLVVVTFHSIEDRIVKRFMQLRSSDAPKGSRFAPETEDVQPAFERITRRAIVAGEDEIAANPRARSAKLRIARRTDAPAGRIDPSELGAPILPGAKGGRK